MPSLNDEKFAALRTQLFTGAMPDMTLQWLQANGATSANVNDAWREMLAATLVGTPIGQRNDDWRALLIEQGMDVAAGSDQLNDMSLAFWNLGGTFT
ncbi:MAG: hypothetical protein V7700_16445 [Halioglobus sp.]